LGHKVHPMGFRLGVIKDWQSKWYSDTHYAEYVQEDVRLREAIRNRYREAAISLMEIDRQAKDVTITLHTARPGIVIGRGGQRVDEMRLFLEGLIGKRVRLNIQEIRQPELDAYLVARAIAEQIERRVAYRRAMKQAMFRTIQAGAKGIKVSAAGRLGNAEIARRQTSHEGQVPLHTLRADIDYGFTEAHTTLGRIGIKVWIYKGAILPELKVEAITKPGEATAETAAAAPATGVAEKLAAAIAESAAPAPAAEAAEKPVEAAAEVPAIKSEKKPAAPRARKPAKAAAPEAVAEKPAAPRVRKTAKAAAPEAAAGKPVEAVAEAAPEKKPTEAIAEAVPEKKPARPRARKPAKAAAPEEKEAKDATAQEG
jgi:small subunit ribosomal protein S3